MGLTPNDFLLTENELQKINFYFHRMAESYAKAGEDAPQGAGVTFEFTPTLGRLILVHFDGQQNGYLISDDATS